MAAAGNFKFDIYSSRPEAAAWVFSRFAQCNECHDEAFSLAGGDSYPLTMWLMTFVVAYTDYARWRAVRKYNKRLPNVCTAIHRFKPKIDVFIENHPRLEGDFEHTGHVHEHEPVHVPAGHLGHQVWRAALPWRPTDGPCPVSAWKASVT